MNNLRTSRKIDWEFAAIGDPAYDLAIVTRGDRKLMGINNGLNILVENYRKAGGIELSAADVRIHELLLFLSWLWESAEAEKKRPASGTWPGSLSTTNRVAAAPGGKIKLKGRIQYEPQNGRQFDAQSQKDLAGNTW